jgi:hypothetical protein
VSHLGSLGAAYTPFFIMPVFTPPTVGPATAKQSCLRPLPTWAEDYRGLLNIPVNGALTGVTQVAGVPASLWVRCYYRDNGFQVGAVKSNAAGEFAFYNLDPDALYYCIAFDDTNTAPDYNAEIYDLLSPVTV